MECKKKKDPKQKDDAKELKLDDLEKASGGSDNPFKDVPRVTTYDYDETIKSKV